MTLWGPFASGPRLPRYVAHDRPVRQKRMKVQIVRKLADELNGIDLSDVKIGDLVVLAKDEAEMLIAESWAIKPKA